MTSILFAAFVAMCPGTASAVAVLLSTASLVSEDDIPVAAHAALKTIEPDGVLLRPEEIDSSQCRRGSLGPVLKVDLNGDGRDDYVVLVKLREPNKNREPVRVHLVLLLSGKNGIFHGFFLMQLYETLPLHVWLAVQPPGTVEEEGDEPNVASIRTHCQLWHRCSYKRQAREPVPCKDSR